MVKLVRQTMLMQSSGEKKVAALLVMNIRCPRIQHLSENMITNKVPAVHL